MRAGQREWFRNAGDFDGPFGSRVTIERDDGRTQTFRIVGEDEADPAEGLLSYVSPLARALTGKRVGEIVPAGQSEAEILAIEAVSDDPV